MGGGPRLVVSTAALHARVRGSVPGLGGLKETKMLLHHPRVKVSIVGSLRDREVACSASENFESGVWRAVSSQSSHHPQKVLLAQFSLYVHKGGLKPDSFHSPDRLWETTLFVALQIMGHQREIMRNHNICGAENLTFICGLNGQQQGIMSIYTIWALQSNLYVVGFSVYKSHYYDNNSGPNSVHLVWQYFMLRPFLYNFSLPGPFAHYQSSN